MRPINRPSCQAPRDVSISPLARSTGYIGALLAIILALMGPARADAPSIVVDGSKLPADVPAVVSGDHVLVPLRGVFERFGARVWYEASAQRASASLKGTLIQVQIGSRNAWVNGRQRTLDVGAREIAGRVMIPLRFVAEALGVSVDYDGPSNTVVIVTGFKPGSFAAGIYSTNAQVANAAPKVAPSVEDERPGSGELIGSQYPSIYARFRGGTSAVNPSTVQIIVDGADVTGSASISSAYVSYTPSSALETGQHTVSVSGAAEDGTPFSASWTFRVDAGSSTDYTRTTFGSGASGFGGGFFNGGFEPFGFPRFGFFPPGFSVFTPGSLFFVSGNVIEVIFVSRFFPFGNAFFTISGFPGVFQLTPWMGNPGFFWGFATVPFGVTARDAIISARFTMPDGRKVVVHSTAPMQIEGQRRSLPGTLHYAVFPRLIGRPTSPRHLVVFRRLEPAAPVNTHPVNIVITRTAPAIRGGTVPIGRVAPVVTHPAPVVIHPGPIGVHPAPIGIHPAPIIIHPPPMIRPILRQAPIVTHPMPVMMPLPRAPSVTQWQILVPPRQMMPVQPVKPK